MNDHGAQYWWLWKDAVDALNDRGDSHALTELLRDHTAEMSYPVRVILAEMLDPESRSTNTKLVPKKTNAAIKVIEKYSVLVERIAVIQRHIDGGKNISTAIADAADELGLSADRMWQNWNDWLHRTDRKHQKPKSH